MGDSLGGDAAAQAERTIILEGLGSHEASVDYLTDYFEGIFGVGSVQSCQIQLDTWTTYRQQELREHTSRCWCRRAPATASVERALEDIDGVLRRDVSARLIAGPLLSRSGEDGSVGQTITHNLVRIVQGIQDLTVGRHKSGCIAFVTLLSVKQCIEAQQSLLSHTKSWRVLRGREPRDMIWRNASVPVEQIETRGLAMRVLCVAGLLFWSIPVSMIQSVTNAASLEKQLPFVSSFRTEVPALYTLVTGYLPALALIALQAVLPYIFHWMAYNYEGHKSRVEVERIVLVRCLRYQLASLYVTVISGSLWASFKDIGDNGKEGLLCVGLALPKQAVYFMTFVLARAGMSLPLLLVRPSSLCRAGQATLVRCEFGSQAADLALVFVIALTYSIVAPSILPICMGYFMLAGFAYRWLFSSVYVPEFDGGGAFWFDLFYGVMLGSFLGSLCIVGMATQYADIWQVSAITPLPLFVVVFGYNVQREWSPANLVSLEDAVQVDAEPSQPVLQDDLYVDPAVQALQEGGC